MKKFLLIVVLLGVTSAFATTAFSEVNAATNMMIINVGEGGHGHGAGSESPDFEGLKNVGKGKNG